MTQQTDRIFTRFTEIAETKSKDLRNGQAEVMRTILARIGRALADTVTSTARVARCRFSPKT